MSTRPLRRAAVLLLLGSGACEAPRPAGERACEDATERYGELVCVHEVNDRATWTEVTIDGELSGQVRSTKYLLPASEEALLPPLIVDSGTFELHSQMLAEAFQDQYGGFTQWDYSVAVLDPDRRLFWSGNLDEYDDGAGGTWFGFTVWDDASRLDRTIRWDQVELVWETLQPRFGLGSLRFVPNSANQRAASRDWPPLPFPIAGVDDDIAYEVYTTGEAWGTARVLTLQELETASLTATYGFQDILVLSDSPFDVPRPVSGVITAGRQASLSHLNVRSAARGTPNCYVREAMEQLAPWGGQLVHLRCGAESWEIEAGDPGAAQAFWEGLRPSPVPLKLPDRSWTELAGLLDFPTGTAGERTTGLRRYGAKGRNLATLYQRIDATLRLDGFLIPFAAYHDFMTTRGFTVDLGQGPGQHSFQEVLDHWHQNPAFLTDGALRAERLRTLRMAMEAAQPPPTWTARIGDRIDEVFPGGETMVRLRSSGNAEDGLRFTGAGLYESTSVCLADDRDADDEGPSRFDPESEGERGVRRGLTRVWAGLWTTRAWEERAWYGIDQGSVSMAVLVDTRVAHERANAVAFSGHPGLVDDRFVVDAQVGEAEVVSSAQGLWPERSLLTLEDGEVVRIARVGRSSLSPDADVLDDGTLRDLGTALAHIVEVFPIDEVAPPGIDVLLDTEWKLDAAGRLVVKQVRPFPRAHGKTPAPAR